MANVKRVALRFEVPFNYYEDQDLASRFAFMQSPSSGLRVKFHAGETYRPNAHGGRTAFYVCEVHGEEAVAFSWIEALVEGVQRVGGLVDGQADDVESGRLLPDGRWEPRDRVHFGRGHAVETFETTDARGRRVRVTIPGGETC